MVDSREGLKQNVETDLRKRILLAKKVLTELQASLRQVEDESLWAKDEVVKGAESVQQMVNKRSLELTRRIDAVCSQQITLIQEEIQSTCMTIGSLQSMLLNLGSFDRNQLAALHLPHVSSSPNVLQSEFELQIDNVALTNEINRWGSVSLKDHDFDFVQDHASSSNSVMSFGKLQKLPCVNANELKGVPNVYLDQIDIDKWISGKKTGEQDDAVDGDFEMVSLRKNSCSTDSENSASIVCVEEGNNELSKWLEPKSQAKNRNVEEQHNATYLHNNLSFKKNQAVDFPCLRTDPKTWVPVKTNRLRCFENVPAKGIFPPEYTLPAPFWLKTRC